MIYFADKKIAFFHIPKTGGTSLRRFLGDPWTDGKFGTRHQRCGDATRHELLSETIHFLGNESKTTTIVAAIRKPYEIVSSLYFFARQLNKQTGGPPPTMPQLQIVMEVDFAGFVEWYSEQWPSVFDFLKVGKRVPENVRLIKLESLAADLDKLFNDELNLGIDTSEIPVRRETGEGKNYLKHYTNQKLFEIVTHKEQWLFDRGFYEVEGKR